MEYNQQYNYDYFLKVSIIGDRGSGKTCLCDRIVNNQFISKYLPPIGIDYKTKFYIIDNKIIRTAFWEFCYSNRYCPIGDELKGSTLLLLIFDMSNSDSFHSLKYYYKRISHQFLLPPPIFCIGTKSDLPSTISERQILKQLKKMNYPPLYYSSSLTGSACNSIHSDIITILSNKINDIIKQPPSQDDSFSFLYQSNSHSHPSKKCCLS
ncbi:hypothetical protein, conserved [Entamoeba dispar SAW760]|uniref:Uncharacterized protein n=1 Tax=Entamoeba dispar (strain ATCC PRA-260 / SAW760) TaxID=370354 RepID=B0EE22_ENTDS|nr:uncharacterized protein EDI_178580 [Entamoeba dispar SAW760]XP_001737766.1 uncharacterized protein EDI_044130 [Entamoeba dispar SAW760]EDR25857.1 hypothetical protein, conserved [Entamoeba dispar SAW760]EDR27225.1 hypothetical protein, conserved [Entamoeba dispar SAW760]|eukprot:EDR25857.1 hypothetical protein, conserved [Entamoeba dispar SAW760]